MTREDYKNHQRELRRLRRELRYYKNRLVGKSDGLKNVEFYNRAIRELESKMPTVTRRIDTLHQNRTERERVIRGIRGIRKIWANAIEREIDEKSKIAMRHKLENIIASRVAKYKPI